ncbi:MAG: mechanosensitive ion channel family protein [Burkholderiales bacterium]
MEVDTLIEPLHAVMLQVGAFLPRLAIALIALIAGWLLAKAARFAVVKGLRAINFNVLTERAGLDEFLKQGGIRSDTTDIFGVLVYWLIVLAALVIAFNALGLNYMTDLVRQVVMFVPRLMVALVILAFGSYFARFVAGAVMAYCRNVGIQDGDILGRLAQYAILAFVVLIALEHMQIGGDIVRYAFLIVLAGVILALALAFGLGGRDWAAQLLERWWPRGRNDARSRIEDLPRRAQGTQRHDL